MGWPRPPLGAGGPRTRPRLLSRGARRGTPRRRRALGSVAVGLVGKTRRALGDGLRVVGGRAPARAVRSPALGGARQVPRAPRAGFRRRAGGRQRRAEPGACRGGRRARARRLCLPPRPNRAAPDDVTELSADAQAACRRAQLIGGALVSSIVVYVYVLRVVAAHHAPFIGFAPSLDLRLLRVIFALVAVVDLAMLRVLTSSVLGTARPAPTAGGGASVAARLTTLSIVRLAICEAVAILGVLLFLLGGRWADFSGFAVASLAAFAFNFPRRSQWEDWVRQLPR